MALLDQTRIIQKQSGNSERRVSFVNKQKYNMYTHYDEPLFDYIIIRESDDFVNGYRIA